MAKVVTLGEIMLRLSSPGQKRFVQSECSEKVHSGEMRGVFLGLKRRK